jgi:hypothetical protein
VKKTSPTRTPPYYVTRRADTAEQLEVVLNNLRDDGFTILHVLPGYVVVALMPDRL